MIASIRTAPSYRTEASEDHPRAGVTAVAHSTVLAYTASDVAVPRHFFVACAPGLETLLLDEVLRLDPHEAVAEPGGIEVEGNDDFVYRANVELGLALSVRLRVGAFKATHFDGLVRGIRALPWSDHLTGGVTIDVHSKRSRLYHTAAIEQRVREGIQKAIGHAPEGEPTTAVHIRFLHDRCTVSIDTSGASLVRRDYREGTGKAPLRTDLARAIVKLSGWTPDLPLIDPFSGSGTIPIEAGLLGLDRAPGIKRRFAFEDAPWFDRERLDAVRTRAVDRESSRGLDLYGSDRDAGVVRVATENAERAGISVRFDHAAISDAPGLAIDAPVGVVVSNPPYGHRVSKGSDLRPLFQRLGARLKDRPEWGVVLLVSDVRLAHHAGLGLTEQAYFDHGGTRVRVMARRV